MRLWLLLFSLVCLASNIYSQQLKEIKGVLRDSTDTSIEGATVSLTSQWDTLTVSTTSSGTFRFKGVQASLFQIRFSRLGYTALNQTYKVPDSSKHIDLNIVVLKSESITLDTLLIDAEPDMLIRGDTIDFRTRHIFLPEYATVEDLMKRLPGMHVDLRGNLWFNGEKIDKVRINGIDFFGGDVALALQNLPADLINKAQVIRDYGEIAALTGVKEGIPNRVLNLMVDDDRNLGAFSNSTAGLGTSNIYQLESNSNLFKGARQLAIGLGKNNGNIALPLSGAQDKGTLTLENTQGGVSTQTGGRLYYMDSWGEKLKAELDYKIFKRENYLEANTYKIHHYTEEKSISNNQSDWGYDRVHHDIQAFVRYQPDQRTQINISPNFMSTPLISTYESNETITFKSGAYAGSQQNRSERSNTHQDGKTIRTGGIAVNRKLNDRGRNILFQGNFGMQSNTIVEQRMDSITYWDAVLEIQGDSVQHQRTQRGNRRYDMDVSLRYTAPLGKRGKLDITVGERGERFENNRSVYDLLDQEDRIDSLSRSYWYTHHESNLTLRYRSRAGKLSYSLGLMGLSQRMRGQILDMGKMVNRSLFDIVPELTAEWSVTPTNQLQFNYKWESQLPDFQQLNPVVDRNNPQAIIQGNPYLDPQSVHQISLGIRGFSPKTLVNFNGRLQFTYYSNRAVEEISLHRDFQGMIIQTTGYDNLGGDYSVKGNFFLYTPFGASKKYHFNFSTSGAWVKQSYLSDHMRQSSTQFQLLSSASLAGVGIDWVQFTPEIKYLFQKTTLSGLVSSTGSLSMLDFSLTSRFVFLKTFAANITGKQAFNSGYASAIDVNPMVLDFSLEKHFFKNKSGVLKLRVQDLFDQNIALSRTVQPNSIIDRQSNTVGRFFLLSYSQRLGKFK